MIVANVLQMPYSARTTAVVKVDRSTAATDSWAYFEEEETFSPDPRTETVGGKADGEYTKLHICSERQVEYWRTSPLRG
jgi:hypothetical protein